jgi:hypothetical protein
MNLSQATEMPNELPCREDLEEIIKDFDSPNSLGTLFMSHLHKDIEIPTSKERGRVSRISWLRLNITRITQPRELIIANRRQAMEDWLDFKLK